MRLGTASTISGPRKTEACPGAACLRRLGSGGMAWATSKKWGKPWDFPWKNMGETFELWDFVGIFENGIEWNLIFLDSWDNAIFHQQQFLHHLSSFYMIPV